MKKMTKKALEEAFAGESMAHMKYAIFAEIAESEGFRNISRLFRAISYAELVHARNHARELGYLGKTPENLQSGIEGETLYPVYRATAEMQGESGAVRSTTYALEAERIHANMYKDAKGKAEAGSDIGDEPIYICPVCGYTVMGEPPERCPVCGVPKEKFRKF